MSVKSRWDALKSERNDKNKFNDTTVLLYTNNLAINNDLKVIEIPITFNRRIGQSKYTGSNRKGIKFGFIMLWYIIKS